MNILIIEDHKPSAAALKRVLTQKFNGAATCYIAETLAEGLKMTRDYSIDITLLDLCLPDSTVDEVIKSIPKFTPPVIVITDLDDENNELEIRCYEYCAQNFFPKQVLRQKLHQNTGADLLSAITKSYWRNSLPKMRIEREKNSI